MASEVWIVRHGETEWSRAGRHTSTTDVPLTEEGVRVGESLRARLAGQDFELVLTSPRLRARRTAELAGFPDAVPDDELREWDYGDYEGITTAQIRQDVPGWSIWTDGCPGGESASEVATRLDRVIDRLGSVPGRVLLFAHGHSLRVLAARWLGQPAEEGRFFYLDTATLSILGDDRGQAVVRRWNA